MQRGNGICKRCYRTVAGVFGDRPSAQPTYHTPSHAVRARAQHSNLYRLIDAYRTSGHLISNINPVLTSGKPVIAELDTDYYMLDPLSKIHTNGLLQINKEEASLSEIVNFLKEAYCQHITAEMGYLPEPKKKWLAEALEKQVNKQCTVDDKKRLAKVLLQSQTLDLFLAKKFPTLKRYGLEGAEGSLGFFMAALTQPAAGTDKRHLVVAMTHRGRINLLTTLLNVRPALLFSKIRGGAELTVQSPIFTGDVLSHVFCGEDIGHVHVSMLPNPSHLEVANPVSMGRTRAAQLERAEGGYGGLFGQPHGTSVVNVQVHGDAAFAGQGVNQETLALCNVANFTVGGTVHLVVNNQLGFTTPGERGRSSRYSSDLAKAILAPVIHVNGDHPEAVLAAGQIAFKYQQEMKEDIFVEVHCYRRRGHNELDDPTFTNPDLYKIISPMETLPDKYASNLIAEGILAQNEVTQWEDEYLSFMNEEFRSEIEPPSTPDSEQWTGIEYAAHNITVWDTGLDLDTLRYIGIRSVSYPSSFVVHPHLLKSHIDHRKQMMLDWENRPIDWSTAEALAFGSLLVQGFNVRISGQDVGRGTFSQRHAMLVDQVTGDIVIPLNQLKLPTQGHLEVANSILSEEAVLAYEYGVSTDSPKNLVVWEAQFGDFANCAQSVIDTYVVSGEAKWGLRSGLTMLLPHGYDGAGPEHSSCRLERFLQLCNSSETESDGDDVNVQVVNPTTPAQYFHLLRRQLVRNFRKPLVVVSPKTLLRLSAATSSLSELGPGSVFQDVISVGKSSAKTIVFTSGKHYYALADSPNLTSSIALVRVECLCPFPSGQLQQVLESYPNATSFVWSQEEPRNQGAWAFVRPRFENLVGVGLRYAGRPELSTAAYGLASLHKSSDQSVHTATFQAHS